MVEVGEYLALRNVYHGAIFPGNILFFQSSSTWKLSGTRFAKNWNIGGDSDFRAPEISFRTPNDTVDWLKCDVFSMGLVFFL